jgi:hypothetical protein
MTMAPRLRKFGLTGHVDSSVGWLGAVSSFLALAVTGLTWLRRTTRWPGPRRRRSKLSPGTNRWTGRTQPLAGPDAA